MHRTIEPAIHYWGTPVLIISSLNEDGSANLAPMSSAWWLGWSCMLGLDASSQTLANLRRQRECVLNLASVNEADAVNRLALTSGTSPLPMHKQWLGYRHVADKFAQAGLRAQPSEQVAPPRVQECQVQLEAEVVDVRPFGTQDPRLPIPSAMVELRIVRAHVHASILQDDHADRIDPQRWQPLMMKFRQLYGGGAQVMPESILASCPEEMYAPWKAR
ncbi:flavin reductase family protein [Paucibacter sp. B2R-40]|uniref:flavin reductase family protein n=1 Tax=Paucibacter sp. B2R-40 TaxID=2893554 RepID=UPI0021E4F5A1|nr:flavin reductase family protein [Paucibacter sp. B2R-40]MCV2353628.1 flavin reductase family protein [Paucibacter sp. B2R-40]